MKKIKRKGALAFFLKQPWAVHCVKRSALKIEINLAHIQVKPLSKIIHVVLHLLRRRRPVDAGSRLRLQGKCGDPPRVSPRVAGKGRESVQVHGVQGRLRGNVLDELLYRGGDPVPSDGRGRGAGRLFRVVDPLRISRHSHHRNRGRPDLPF